MKYETLKEVRELVERTLMKCGTPELIKDLKVEFNSRFTRRAGDAKYQKVVLKEFGLCAFEARVRFSVPLWPRMTEEDRLETVIHEACHLAAEHLSPGKQVGHGREWKVLMLICRANGDRCHTIDRTGLKRTLKRHPAKCGCRTHLVGPKVKANMVKALEAGKRNPYYCPKCKEYLTLLDETGAPLVVRERIFPLRPYKSAA